MDDLQRARAALERLKQTLQENRLPIPNDQARAEISRAISDLRGLDSYVSEKAGKIGHMADVYYSARRHQKYAGGPDRLHSDMLHDLCKLIRDQLDHLETLRKGREQ